MLHSLRAFAISVCAAAAMLALSHGHAVAGISVVAPAFGSNSATANGWLIGGHAGYNWQQGSAVFGFETDLQGTDLHSSMQGGLMYPFPVSPPFGDFARTASGIDWYGTLRGRLGIANGSWLFYGTGGLAYGDVGLRSDFSTLGLFTSARTSDFKTGWVVGAGVEYLWRPNVSFSLGYQYVDLGTLSLLSSASGGPFIIGQTASVHAQFQAVMAGFSLRFAPVASSAPWAGGYAGVHAGGAWGDDTAANYTSVEAISDKRLKRDIALVGRRGDGLGIYSYRYLWSDTVYVGVMAQEVALVHPEAVVRDPLTGYLSVNYTRLGLHLMVLQEPDAPGKTGRL